MLFYYLTESINYHMNNNKLEYGTPVSQFIIYHMIIYRFRDMTQAFKQLAYILLVEFSSLAKQRDWIDSSINLLLNGHITL